MKLLVAPGFVSSSRRIAVAALLFAGGSTLGGCHFWNHLWGKDTVDLSKADVQSMSVDIRKERKTICPREQVQMAVFADVILEGDKDKKSLETWAGKGSVNKNDKMDFVDFAFHSDQGHSTRTAGSRPPTTCWRRPTRSSRSRPSSRRQPDKFSFTTKYKPDYQCIKARAARAGRPATPATSGSQGNGGKDGQSGSDSQSRRLGQQRRARRARRRRRQRRRRPAHAPRSRRW